MKNLELSTNLEELSMHEQKNIHGGNPWLVAAAIATVIYYGNECSKEIQKGWDMYKD